MPCRFPGPHLRRKFRGICSWGEPTVRATAAGSTHPTGMHYFLWLLFTGPGGWLTWGKLNMSSGSVNPSGSNNSVPSHFFKQVRTNLFLQCGETRSLDYYWGFFLRVRSLWLLSPVTLFNDFYRPQTKFGARSCFYTCMSFCWQTEAGSTHPTGMHTCVKCFDMCFML